MAQQLNSNTIALEMVRSVMREIDAASIRTGTIYKLLTQMVNDYQMGRIDTHSVDTQMGDLKVEIGAARRRLDEAEMFVDRAREALRAEME